MNGGTVGSSVFKDLELGVKLYFLGTVSLVSLEVPTGEEDYGRRVPGVLYKTTTSQKFSQTAKYKAERDDTRSLPTFKW